MTGLRAITRGLSFRKDAPMAGTRMAGSYRLLCRRRLRGWGSPPVLAMTVMTGNSLRVREDAGVELELLENRTECQRREEGQGTDDQDGADEKSGEERGVGGEGARAGGDDLLLGQRTGQGQHRDHEDDPAQPHGGGQRGVVEE